MNPKRPAEEIDGPANEMCKQARPAKREDCFLENAIRIEEAGNGMSGDVQFPEPVVQDGGPRPVHRVEAGDGPEEPRHGGAVGLEFGVDSDHAAVGSCVGQRIIGLGNIAPEAIAEFDEAVRAMEGTGGHGGPM